MKKRKGTRQKEPSRQLSLLPAELPFEALVNLCDSDSLGFKTTDELPDLQAVIGQPRAFRALELGSEVTGSGYNIFVLGLPGSGRTTLSQEYFERRAVRQETPDDWCYVFNFENPRKPRALRLPAGRGKELKRDLAGLVVHCRREIPRAFDSKEYVQARDKIVEGLNKNQEEEFLKLQNHVEKYNFLIARTPFGIVLVPSIEGKPIKPEDLEKISDEQRTKLEQLQSKLSVEVDATLSRLRKMAHDTAILMDNLNKQTASFLIQPVITEIKSNFEDLPSVLEHLEKIQVDIISNANRFIPGEKDEQTLTLDKFGGSKEWTGRYDVNLLVDNSATEGAPVIVETHPVYQNLLGRIEHEVVMGASRTEFSMIQAGAFHRANGGYLILPARDLLVNAYAWEGVKRVLRDGCLRILELGSQIGLLSTETLDPEPIPLELKIILIGTPLLYYLLQTHDEDFTKLFKVRAEFGTLMDRNPDSEKEYGLFVKSVVVDNELPPFDNSAVARIIEFSSRMAEDQQKLSTRFGRVADLVREAAYWSKKEDDKGNTPIVVDREAVQRAIDEAIYRNNLINERIQEMIAQDTLMIETTGFAVGRLNGLSVMSLGDFSFGRPSRITATVSPGKAGVVDIERQAKLGGPIHTKGVLILSGYLNNTYGRSEPMNLSASLTFEQSYSEIEGDSASAGELIALLSAISQIPVRQDLAVTGSINQHGSIQAIGGVNEKVEGFYATCKAKGLTGNQGVLIPKSNQRHLMLKDEVVQAVSDGKFHIWPVSNIDEAIVIFTEGMQVGVMDNVGNFPPGSFNNQVMEKLEEFSKALRGEEEDNPEKGIKKKSTEKS